MDTRGNAGEKSFHIWRLPQTETEMDTGNIPSLHFSSNSAPIQISPLLVKLKWPHSPSVQPPLPALLHAPHILVPCLRPPPETDGRIGPLSIFLRLHQTIQCWNILHSSDVPRCTGDYLCFLGQYNPGEPVRVVSVDWELDWVLHRGEGVATGRGRQETGIENMESQLINNLHLLQSQNALKAKVQWKQRHTHNQFTHLRGTLSTKVLNCTCSQGAAKLKIHCIIHYGLTKWFNMNFLSLWIYLFLSFLNHSTQYNQCKLCLKYNFKSEYEKVH